MQRVTDGQQLYSMIDELHGAIWQLPSEPSSASARDATLKLCKHLDDMNGSYQDYPKKAESSLNKLEKQFQLRNLLDRLSNEQVHVYAGTHYRFEAIVTEDVSDVLYDRNDHPVYATGWSTCWAGVLERDWIDALEKSGNTIMENYGFRDLLAVKFTTSDEPNDNIISTFEVDPTNLLSKDNPHVRAQFDFWASNAQLSAAGEAPMTMEEYKAQDKKSPNPSKRT